MTVSLTDNKFEKWEKVLSTRSSLRLPEVSEQLPLEPSGVCAAENPQMGRPLSPERWPWEAGLQLEVGSEQAWLSTRSARHHGPGPRESESTGSLGGKDHKRTFIKQCGMDHPGGTPRHPTAPCAPTNLSGGRREKRGGKAS